jgi:hypothetical protein
MAIFRLLKFRKGFGYPVGDNLYYRCSLCRAYIRSVPIDTATCICGNVMIDVPSKTIRESRRGTAHLMRKIG